MEKCKVCGVAVFSCVLMKRAERTDNRQMIYCRLVERNCAAGKC